jgi:hypothetical protein
MLSFIVTSRLGESETIHHLTDIDKVLERNSFLLELTHQKFIPYGLTHLILSVHEMLA